MTNLNHVENISSIMRYGLLSHSKALHIEHHSIAMEEVQAIREDKRVTNGMLLHRYASLYFAPRNPMMYYLTHHPEMVDTEKLCVLMVNPEVLDFDGVVVTDGNAADGMTRFFSPAEGIPILDYGQIYAQYWNDVNPYIKDEKKRIKCAEVLVPSYIPYEMIVGALVPSERSQDILQSLGFQKKVLIHPDTFFL